MWGGVGRGKVHKQTKIRGTLPSSLPPFLLSFFDFPTTGWRRSTLFRPWKTVLLAPGRRVLIIFNSVQIMPTYKVFKQVIRHKCLPPPWYNSSSTRRCYGELTLYHNKPAPGTYRAAITAMWQRTHTVMLCYPAPLILPTKKQNLSGTDVRVAVVQPKRVAQKSIFEL